MSLSSKYVIRLYKIFKDELEKNNRYYKDVILEMSIDELKKILEIPKSYQFSSHLKKRILDKAKEEFKKHTDIIFDYEISEKIGKKVNKLKFYVYDNPSKEIKEVEDKYFKSRKSFVALLRRHYSGNLKMFGYKMLENEFYWLGLDKKGLVYATPISYNQGLENKNFNGIESAKMYDLWLKIAKGSALYKDLVVNGEDLIEIKKYHKDLWQGLVNDIKYLKSEGII